MRSDVANSTDPSHYLDWKKRAAGSRPYLPEEVAKYFPADQFDPDGMYATFVRPGTEVIGYKHQPGPSQRMPRRATPTLLDPKWLGQDRQGPSQLQRRDHDSDLRTFARTGLALF